MACSNPKFTDINYDDCDVIPRDGSETPQDLAVFTLKILCQQERLMLGINTGPADPWTGNFQPEELCYYHVSGLADRAELFDEPSDRRAFRKYVKRIHANKFEPKEPFLATPSEYLDWLLKAEMPNGTMPNIVGRPSKI